jgi:hypothetical protein
MTGLDLNMSTNNLDAAMKTREQIITSMCYTMRHDYGIIKEPQEFTGDKTGNFFVSGMHLEEREALWRQMAQIFDNDIAPYMEFKQ